MKADQERVAKLLNDTVTLLCKNGLIYKNSLTVQGLLGITLDKSDVFLVHINEFIGTPSSADGNQKQRQSFPAASNVVDLTKIADSPVTASCHQHPHALRYQNPLNSPVLGPARKQRPQMINQSMLLQRNELLHQVQQRLRMNAAIVPQGMGPMPVPIVPMPAQTFQPRQPMPRPPMLRQKSVAMPRRPNSLQQQNQNSISLVDEDDVVIVGTGREEPHSSPRRSHAARAGRPPLLSRNFRLPSNESHPIIIPPDCGPFHDITSNLEVPYPLQSMQAIEGISRMNPPGFSESKNYLGEIVIEPTGSTDLDIASIVELNRDPKRVTGRERMDIGGMPCQPELPSDAGKSDGNPNPQDKITVYLDVADDGAQNDFKPCCGGDASEATPRSERAEDAIEARDNCRRVGEETLNLDSLGLHMLTEGDDEPQMTPNSWHCKVPTCQAFYSESSQLASHYILEHTRQLDLSVRDVSGADKASSSRLEDVMELDEPMAWHGVNHSDALGRELQTGSYSGSDIIVESMERKSKAVLGSSDQMETQAKLESESGATDGTCLGDSMAEPSRSESLIDCSEREDRHTTEETQVGCDYEDKSLKEFGSCHLDTRPGQLLDAIDVGSTDIYHGGGFRQLIAPQRASCGHLSPQVDSSDDHMLQDVARTREMMFELMKGEGFSSEGHSPHNSRGMGPDIESRNRENPCLFGAMEGRYNPDHGPYLGLTVTRGELDPSEVLHNPYVLDGSMDKR